MQRLFIDAFDGGADTVILRLRGLDQQGIGLDDRGDANLAAILSLNHTAAPRSGRIPALLNTPSVVRLAILVEIAEAAGGDFFQPRRQCSAGILARVRAATAEQLSQVAGQHVGLQVLDPVHVELRAGPCRATIQRLDPLFSLLEVFRLRCNHHQRAEALEGDKTKHARQRRVRITAENRCQLGGNGFHVHRGQWINAYRHSFQPVNIEDLDGLQVIGQLLPGPGQENHVAQRVDIDDGVIAHIRLQDLRHFGRAHILQGRHANLVAPDIICSAHLRGQMSPDGVRHR